MIDISPHHQEIIEDILRKHVPDCEVRAFGSRVTWTAKDYSDLDLAIVGKEKLPSKILSQLKESFEESDLPFRVDALDWNAISPEFRKVVEKQYEVIQKSAEQKQVQTGGIPEGWEEVFLKDVVVVNEKTIDKRYQHDEIEYIDIASVDKGRVFEVKRLLRSEAPSRAKRIVRDSDILLSTVRPNLKHFAFMKTVNPNTIASTGFAVISSKKVDARFLYYYLTTNKYTNYLSAIADAHTSTYPAFNPDILENSKIPFPPENEQRSIAKILSDLDAKIELNHQMNKTLEQIAQAIFKQWFVDSAENNLPTGWRLGKLCDVAENRKQSIQPSKIEPTMPYMGLEHLPRHCISLSDWAQAIELGSNKFKFKRGNILFGKLRPYFHKCGVAPIDGVCSTDILVIAPREPEWFGFVLGHVSSIEFVNYTTNTSTGTRMPRTSWKDMACYEVALPPKNVAADFTGKIRPLVDKIIANIYELRILSKLRDSLLPRLMSGKIRVK